MVVNNFRTIFFHSSRLFSTVSKQQTMVNAQHCADLVRTQDYDYWLMGLLLPQSARPGFYAIRAFNIETSSIIDTVGGNVIPGKMRIQWWKDVIHEKYTSGITPIGHPVASSLSDAISHYQFSRRWFDRCLEARLRELEEEQPLTLFHLEQNCDHSNASLILLTLECLGFGPNDHSEHVAMDIAAQHLGQGVGICNYLRGTAVHASKGRLYIPVELLKKHDADARYIMKGPISKNGDLVNRKSAAAAVKELAQRAHAHLTAAEGYYLGHPPPGKPTKGLQAAPRGAQGAFLPAVRSSLYLTELGNCGYDLHHPSLWPTPEHEQFLLGFQLRLLGGSLRIFSPFKFHEPPADFLNSLDIRRK